MSSIDEGENQDGTPLSDKENSKRKRNKVVYNDNNDDDEEVVKVSKSSKKSSKKRVSNDDDDDDEDDKMKNRAASKKNKPSNDNDRPLQSQSQLDDDDLDDDDLDDLDDLDVDERLRDYEAGQILEIDVENFMCHRRMTVKLGRNVNFITGQNGSGKSAIAAAIQLVCGANTKDTGRGKSLGNLVREGSEGPAVLTVKLLNVGVDAFEPTQYGSKIIIERKINKSGTSSYKIMNDKRVEMSKEKRDLQKILVHFNIYPDNPMNVLTQEDSKKFINGKEGDKYEFFLKASGLRKVKEELHIAKDEIGEARKNITLIENRLSIKKANKDKLKSELEQFQKLGEISAKIEMANAKLLWIPYYKQVTIKNKLDVQLEDADSDHRDAVSHLNTCQAALGENNSLDVTKEKIETVYKEIDDVDAEISRKNIEISAKQKNVSACGKDLQEVKKKITEFETRKRDIRRDIDDLRKKAASSAKGDEKRLLDDVSRTSRNLDELKKLQTDLNNQKNSSNHELMELQDQVKSSNNAIRNIENEIRTSESELRSLKAPADKGKTTSKYADSARLDGRFPKVLEEIDRTSFLQRPIGPLGMHVQLKSGSAQWEYAVESCVGGMLRTFIVQNFNDRAKLADILRRNGLSQNATIRVEKNPRTTRFSNLRVPTTAGVETVMDQLIISNDLVFNTLVDVCSIESSVLVPTSDPRDVDPFVLNNRMKDNNIKCLITKKAEVVRMINGNKATDANFQKLNHNLKMEGIAAADNTDLINQKQALINDEKARLAELKNDCQLLQNQCDEFKRKINQIGSNISKVVNDIKIANKNKSDLDSKLHEIEEANAIDTSDLETEEQDIDNGVDSLTRQLSDIQHNLNELNVDLKTKQDEKKKLDKTKSALQSEQQSLEMELASLKTNMQNVASNVKTATKAVEAKASFLQNIKNELSKKDAEIEKLRFEAEEGTMKLIKIVDDGGQWDGQPLDLEKKDEESIKREIQKLKKREEEEKKKHGLQGRTETEVTARYRNALADFKASKAEYANLLSHIVDLEADCKERTLKWRDGLRLNTKKVRRRFDQYLNFKGLSGKADFKHADETLKLITRTDNNDINSTCTDVRQLSGGEKSYTTLSLLFALGHVSECPFRLMDEYDVFMDEGARKLTLDMLMEYALKVEQKGRQFIIITPNNLNHVKTNSKVKIIQMQPPDRRERSAAGGLRQHTLEETF